MILLQDSQNITLEKDRNGNVHLVRSTSAPALMVPWRKEGYSIATITFTVTPEMRNGVPGCRVSCPWQHVCLTCRGGCGRLLWPLFDSAPRFLLE